MIPIKTIFSAFSGGNILFVLPSIATQFWYKMGHNLHTSDRGCPKKTCTVFPNYFQCSQTLFEHPLLMWIKTIFDQMQENIFFNFAANLDLMIKSSFSFPDTPFSPFYV